MKCSCQLPSPPAIQSMVSGLDGNVYCMICHRLVMTITKAYVNVEFMEEREKS